MEFRRSVLVYHKADGDGLCSAAIMMKAYRMKPDTTFIPYGLDYDYNEAAFLNDIDNLLLDYMSSAITEVVFADITPRMSTLESLEKTGYNLTIIDHHKTAIDLLEAWCHGEIPGKREIGKAACELCWEYYFPNDEMPRAVKLLGRYDVWDHSDPDTLPFQYGYRQYKLYPDGDDAKLWDYLLMTREEFDALTVEAANEVSAGVSVEDIVESGKIILDYVKKTAAGFARHNSFERTILGKRALCVNSSLGSSMALESLFDPEKHDMMCVFSYSGTQWKVSLYTGNATDTDVSEIAKRFGGGGHKGAAGFQCPSMDWLLNGE